MKITIGIPIEETKIFCIDNLMDFLVRMQKPSKYEIIFVVNQKNKFYEQLSNKIQSKRYKPIENKINIISLNAKNNKTLWNAGDFTNLVRARNRCIDETVKNVSDYLFFLDADIVPPDNVLTKLVEHSKKTLEKSVLASYYDSRFFEDYPMMGNFNGEYLNLLFEGKDFQKKSLVECDAVGMGSVLIPKSLFSLYFNEKVKSSEDVEYFKSLKSMGYKLFVDTSLKAEHISLSNRKLGKLGRKIIIAFGTAIYEIVGPYFMRDQLLDPIEYSETELLHVDKLEFPLVFEDSDGKKNILAIQKKASFQNSKISYILKPKSNYIVDSNVLSKIRNRAYELLINSKKNDIDSFVTIVS